MPRALITGITGQDGSYMAELLLGKGYAVTGLARDPAAAARTANLAAVSGSVRLHAGDLLDQSSLEDAVVGTQPDEVYNLGAFSSVGRSWAEPDLVDELNRGGFERLLAAVERRAPEARLFQASSCDMFGSTATVPQS